jgi:hypothetical protein
MADFPNSVHTFTPFSNGALSDAAQVTDIYGEVEAIADGYLNGKARLNSSNSTVANLSVTGGSTFNAVTLGASTVTTLQVSGLSTFAGVVTLSSGATVSSGVIRQPSLPMWNVYRSTHIAMGSGSSNGVAFDVQDFVRGSIEHSTAANSSRVTINTTGVYHLSASAIAEATAGNPVVKLHVRMNDATDLLTGASTPLASAGKWEHVSANHDVRIDSTCYLTCVMVSSAAASTVGSSGANRAIRFSGHFLG